MWHSKIYEYHQNFRSVYYHFGRILKSWPFNSHTFTFICLHYARHYHFYIFDILKAVHFICANYVMGKPTFSLEFSLSPVWLDPCFMNEVGMNATRGS